MSSITTKLPYVVLRDGRPRWIPGPRLRRLGFRGQDLRHADGRWFTAEECRAFTEARQQEIAARRGQGQSALVVPARARRAPKADSHIYFLRVGDLVKIGYSTKPLSRIDDLRTVVAGKISSLVIVPGTRRDETRLHHALRAHRRNGEWFAATAAVVDAMIGALLHKRALLEPCDLPRAGFAERFDLKTGSQHGSAE